MVGRGLFAAIHSPIDINEAGREKWTKADDQEHDDDLGAQTAACRQFRLLGFMSH